MSQLWRIGVLQRVTVRRESGRLETVRPETPRRELVWAFGAALALILGAACAQRYARLTIPFNTAVTGLIAELYPWKVREIRLSGDAGHGSVLVLTGEVRQHRDDPLPSAIVESRLHAGEAVEVPVVFWTVVLMWPVRSWRHYLLRIVLGVPVFLSLETTIVACQLLHPLAEASAVLAGQRDPLTPWERWSRFLEAGGRFVLEATAAMLTVASAGLLTSQHFRHRQTK